MILLWGENQRLNKEAHMTDKIPQTFRVIYETHIDHKGSRVRVVFPGEPTQTETEIKLGWQNTRVVEASIDEHHMGLVRALFHAASAEQRQALRHLISELAGRCCYAHLQQQTTT